MRPRADAPASGNGEVENTRAGAGTDRGPTVSCQLDQPAVYKRVDMLIEGRVVHLKETLPMRERIRGLVFDKDGTLFDFNATWAAWCDGFILGLAEGDADRAAAARGGAGLRSANPALHQDEPDGRRHDGSRRRGRARTAPRFRRGAAAPAYHRHHLGRAAGRGGAAGRAARPADRGGHDAGRRHQRFRGAGAGASGARRRARPLRLHRRLRQRAWRQAHAGHAARLLRRHRHRARAPVR